MAEKKEEMAEKKEGLKKPAAEVLAETAVALAALLDRMEQTETRVEQLAGQVEAHRAMLQREEKVEPGKVGLQKADYPGMFHASVEKGASTWALVTPKVDYCSPGIVINGFVCPCYAGVPVWMPTPFMQEAIGRGIA